MSKNVYERYKTNKDLESGKGVELDFGDFAFTILRAGNLNKDYDKAAKKFSKKYQRQIRDESIDKEVAKKILIKVYADAVIIGWRGITDESGKVLSFSKENCIKLFTDLPDLFDTVHEEANKFTNFLSEGTEDAKKS